MNVLVTGAFQLNSGEREQLEAAGHKKSCIVCAMTAMQSRVERFKAGSTRARSF